MSTHSINPYDILQQRRKLKQWKKTSAVQCMKILKRVRQLSMPNKMLIATEFPRTLIYVANRTRDSQNQDVKKMNKMCRYLAKEWRKQLGVAQQKEEGEKKEKKLEGEKKQQVKENSKQKIVTGQNGGKIVEEEKKQ